MLPVPIQTHLHQLLAEDRLPAYVLTDEAGAVHDFGGNLSTYGLYNLEVGQPVSEQIFLLEGLLPLAGPQETLRCVHTESGTPADLHFLHTSQGDYTLFLDASRQEEQQRLMQQKGNQLSLNYQRLIKEIQKKEILLHCIVHDLAGPLLGIKGGFELLSNEPLSPQGRKFLEIGLRQADKQERLIREILSAFSAEVEALDSFTIDPELAPDASHSLREVADALQPAFTLNNVRLQLAPADPQVNWKVVGEKSRLERVISNLTENALRHSPPDTTVILGCSLTEESQVLVTIEDEGAGVPVEQSAMLFQKFSQGKKGKGKSGLGLYFCRITIEHWGGIIGHTTREGRGSRFWFRLPRPQATQV